MKYKYPQHRLQVHPEIKYRVFELLKEMESELEYEDPSAKMIFQFVFCKELKDVADKILAVSATRITK